MEQYIYLAGLHALWFYHAKLIELFEKSQNYREVYDTMTYTTLIWYGFSHKQAEAILKNKRRISLELIQNKLSKRWARIITIHDSEYPQELLHIPHVPYILYIRGKLTHTPRISIVWSRSMTSYGKRTIEHLIPAISNYFTIVSWWAAGCDTWTHATTLNNNKNTLSVIGTWIDIDYPVGNKKMYDRIVETGWAVMSIFPVWQQWLPYNFPIRNEVVAGISVGTVVVEAKNKSGTLITAGLALDLWKDLFSVPWDIFHSQSNGCNTLIQSWSAKMVVSSKCILEEYNIWWFVQKSSNITEKKFSHESERKIYNMLLLESSNIDSLSQQLNLSISDISYYTSLLEIWWYIKKTLWWKYEILS